MHNSQTFIGIFVQKTPPLFLAFSCLRCYTIAIVDQSAYFAANIAAEILSDPLFPGDIF